MRAFDSMTGWADAHHPKWLDVLRMLLGVVLFFKGLSFILNKDVTMQVLHDNNYEFVPVLLLHYVIIFQMAHSVLIAIGLITRIAIAAQFPIVLGAAILLLSSGSFAPFGSDLFLVLLLLFLLVFFFIYGAGPLSVDAVLRKAAPKTAGETA